MSYWAHSLNKSGKHQDLKKHLTAVAVLAGHFLDKFGLGEFAYIAGLWHDLGKVNSKFQNKLKNNTNVFIDHKGAGVLLVSRLKFKILQFVIAGHHGGLVNPTSLGNWFNDLDQSILKNSIQKVKQAYPDLFTIPSHTLSKEIEGKQDVSIRMVFSALVDADFLDTESHFLTGSQFERKSEYLNDSLWVDFQRYHLQLTQGKTGKLNEIRKSIYISCVERATESPGFFRLTVPTGGGKTLSSLAFAIKHALHHQKKRVIYAIPFTSIIEQTAGIFKKIFPGRIVLEHHTGVQSDDSNDYPDERKRWDRLASENWGAPIVVSTTVQLFESLLSRKPSRCRKLHNIAGSVIILDEVQTLPMQFMPTIMDILKSLVEQFGVTVVFCTATQPALDGFLEDTGVEPVELAPNPSLLFKKLERVCYYNYSGVLWDWEKVAREMRKSEKTMAVVNTKKDAHSLWEIFEDEEIYHLSAAMCGAHRKDILDEIREKLTSSETCYLVATQVVEAGVDIDFDRVMRAVGPLDRIVQAAGRCNREGEKNKGDVIIFNPEEGSLPKGIYGVAKHKAEQLLMDPKLDLNDPSTFPLYFEAVRKDITEDPDNIEEDRKRLYFEDVEKKFKMIDDDGITVVVPYQPKLPRINYLLKKLKSFPEMSRAILRELQPFMVNLRGYEVKESEHLYSEIFPGLFYWTGRYHERLGLLKEIDLSKSVI